MATQRHKVFVSYHHANDQWYRDQFERQFSAIAEAFVSRSVQIGDIDPNNKTETVRQLIRDRFLRDSTVTVVLIGTETWKRKHVDWEISSSIRKTQFNYRSGLLGIFLPSYPLQNNKYNPYTIPPRLHDNVERGFAKLYNWSDDPYTVQGWIHEAFQNRNEILPDNSRDLFANNRSSSQQQWQ